MTKEIFLSKGMKAIVDDEDYEWLAFWKWYYHGTKGYAVRTSKDSNGKSFQVFMHREILKPSSDLITDHINGNKLDNRRCNLRESNHSQNMQNRKNALNNSSGYKGVHWDNHAKKWQARIAINKERIYLGLFDNPEDAAKEYDKFAKIYHGKFARLNFGALS